jgi:hypothetical protein
VVGALERRVAARTTTAPGWIALSLVALVACTSAVKQCGGCPGSYVDPNGLIRPGDTVASVRVCIDGRCRTASYAAYEGQYGRYGVVGGTYPPNPAHIDTLQVTTFDPDGKVVRTVEERSFDLPVVKKPPKNSCPCYGLRITYDAAAGRFVVATQ